MKLLDRSNSGRARRGWGILRVLLLLVAVVPAVRSAAPPNILFIFTDDHASHAISAYGSRINRTPNLDRLAQEGMLFRNAFCGNSICAPSRATVLTGKHTHVHGQIDNRVTFDGSQQTFPKLLRGAGYQTAIIGKWHLKSEPTGFDHWKVLIGQGTYYNPVFRTPQGNEEHVGYTTDIITDEALAWLEKGRDPDKPFLLMYQHKAPHREWAPGPEQLTLYDDRDLPEPATLFDDYSGRTSAATQQEMTLERHFTDRDAKLVPPSNLTAAQLEKWNAAYGPKNEAYRAAELKGRDRVRWLYQRYIKDYLRCIASVDENVGRVLDYLDRTGLAENTVVVYSSDQGFYLGDHGWFDKRWMYEESLRMPLLVRWPGRVKAGTENRDLVQNIDYAPTFLEMAGVRVPSDIQGRSLVPLLQGNRPEDWRESIYYHYYEYPAVHMVQRHYGVRTDRYKLIHYYLINEWELFDLREDPDELRSVYDDPDYTTVVRRLKTELERLQETYRVASFEEPPAPPNPARVPLAIALRYEFGGVTEGRVRDVSGHHHDGVLRNGTIVEGHRSPAWGKAVVFEGGGQVTLGPVPESLNPWYKPLIAGAWCRPGALDGVVLAQGGNSLGYSLHILKGRPRFALRVGGTLYAAEAPSEVQVGEWVHLAGVLNRSAELQVWVNGEPVGNPVPARFLTGKPADAFTVGADTGPRVGEHSDALHWKGRLEDVRVYWGPVETGVLEDWWKP